MLLTFFSREQGQEKQAESYIHHVRNAPRNSSAIARHLDHASFLLPLGHHNHIARNVVHRSHMYRISFYIDTEGKQTDSHTYNKYGQDYYYQFRTRI